MGAVAILNPHEVLENNLIAIPRVKPTRHQNNRRRLTPTTLPPTRATKTASTPTNLVMGKVKILKRGESLPETLPEKPLPGVMEPGGFYAGSAFIISPPPSSLPLPVFFTKKPVAGELIPCAPSKCFSA